MSAEAPKTLASECFLTTAQMHREMFTAPGSREREVPLKEGTSVNDCLGAEKVKRRVSLASSHFRFTVNPFNYNSNSMYLQVFQYNVSMRMKSVIDYEGR